MFVLRLDLLFVSLCVGRSMVALAEQWSARWSSVVRIGVDDDDDDAAAAAAAAGVEYFDLI
jgi:hypothetical protein